MLINKNTKIIGEKVVLVPYVSKHVECYNNWMQDADLREQTDSELLTLDEEYENCKSWRESNDKITFILLAADLNEMIGDINGFVHEDGIELSVMIANKSYRGKGCAKEAINLLMKYCQIMLNQSRFFAIINNDNVSSIQLFEKIGFGITSIMEVFKQTKLALTINYQIPSICLDYYVNEDL
uniref:N-acetyltransferase domain-containing protein n=1 Tax=Rhabditophanes sp. KR3021 TaxID=114890 RepID=A0AC35U1G0_9BILA